MAERELAIILRAKDLASKAIKGVNKELGKTGKIASKGVGKTFDNVGKLALGAAGVGLAGLAGSIKVAADFESQLNTINTVARKTPVELNAIGESIRKIAKDTGTPLSELTQGYYDLVSAGIDASQATKVLAASNTLAIGGLASAAEGVDLLTTALNSYGVSADQQGAEAQRFSDILAKSVERGKVTAAELAGSFATVGPIAAKMGIEIEEVAAGYAQMTAKGIPAAEAATQMRSAMVSLLRTTKPMEELQKQTGRNYAAIASKKGLAFAFETLRKDAEKAGVPMIELVGRVEALQFSLTTTGDAFAGYNQNLEAMNSASGTAAAQMAERQQGLNYQLSRLKALAIDAGITIGSKLLPKITPLAERAVKFLSTHEDDIEKFGDSIAGSFDKALQFAERIPWDVVGSGLKTAAEWSQRLFDVFLSMPKEVQATIIGLAALNKLSGGAISGIVGELGKGLIKGVLGMTAGVVNLKAGVVKGAGGVGGGAPVTGGGGAGTLMKGLAAASIVADIAAVVATQQQISGASSQQGKEISGTLDTMIAGGPGVDALKRSLAGVNKGISDLESNPLHMLVQGSALEELKTMRAKIESQIEATENGTAQMSKGDRDDAVAAARIKTALDRTRLSTDEAKRDTVASIRSASAADSSRQAATAAAARDAGRQTAAAIKDKDLSVTVPVNLTSYTNVRLSAREVESTVNRLRIRAGNGPTEFD